MRVKAWIADGSNSYPPDSWRYIYFNSLKQAAHYFRHQVLQGVYSPNASIYILRPDDHRAFLNICLVGKSVFKSMFINKRNT